MRPKVMLVCILGLLAIAGAALATPGIGTSGWCRRGGRSRTARAFVGWTSCS